MDNNEPRRDGGEGTNTLDVNLDLGALECPVCCSLFEGAIFQCKNGHAMCGACRYRIHRTCPTCRAPVLDIRCRPLENAISSMVVPCAFASHGCTERLKYTERRVHEALFCRHAPCACPFTGCGYSALLLHDHIRDAHAADAVSFAGSARVRLYRSMPFARAGRCRWSASARAPRATGGVEYKLEVGGGEPGALSLAASGSVPCMRSLVSAGQHPSPTEGFLFVPDAYWDSFGHASVRVHVRGSTLNKTLYILRRVPQEGVGLMVRLVAVLCALALVLAMAMEEKKRHRSG